MTRRTRRSLVRLWIASSTTAIFLGGGCALAQSTDDLLERFGLFNNCKPVVLRIEGLSSDASEIGLTHESIQATVESRLRSARIYTSDREQSSFAYLYVNVTVVGGAFNWDLEFRKMVHDIASELELQASTWEIGGTGTSNDHGYILSAISHGMDQFLVEYLRANESACA